MLRMRWSPVLFCILILLMLAACEKAGVDPTSTPDQESIQAASTLFAQPTHATRPTPTITPVVAVELDLNRVVARMEQAVLAQDKDAYLSYIWPEDSVFLTEHTRWAEDWVDNPLDVFTIELFSIRSPTSDTVKARMTIRWSRYNVFENGSAGGATVSALFIRQGDEWFWAGEDWAYEDIEGFRLFYFKDEIIDSEYEASLMREYLPGVYTLLTREFDFVPEDMVQIKLYENSATLQTLTRISQPQINSWNQPGEAIKVAVDQNDFPPAEMAMARHFARFLLYEMAGGTHGNFPWWLEEGIAAYGEAQFRPLSQRNRTIKGVAALALENAANQQQLRAWDTLGTAPAWDDPARQPIADQAFSLVHYVTETYGTEIRNAWIRAMATDETLDEACASQLGVSFDELDAQWRAWLITQL